MVDRIKRYSVYIILFLLCIILGQSCRSCTYKNRLKWNQSTTTSTIDSLKTVNSNYLKEIDSCKSTIDRLENTIILQQEYIKSLSIDKEFLKKSNNKLINKSLSNEKY